MEGRIWLFFQFLGHDPMVQLVVHTIIASVLALLVAKLAT